ncbi:MULTISPECIES: PRC-barrel domain-containing protein [Bradyrhizobium]|uniref:PRC-barrel domain-containing protein n=1 Tax=Bradyrhizobium pachyrhizi TaxID=280333 RepID=UPI0004052282|nr:PRC-barrel domain-containing protein [Bradyrhizobium pachyrhizi]
MMVKATTGPHQLIASDHVVGMAVRWPNGAVLGHIEWLMIDKASGKLLYAVLSVGGLFGSRTNLIPLPWGRLRYNPKLDSCELDIEDDELRRAPSFRADEDFDWGDRTQEAALHRFHKA